MSIEEEGSQSGVARETVPTERCDLIMKGGITSGVVYPRTIIQLARKYRLASVGGTSAGAIAAGLAAAAEHGRSKGGFEVLNVVARELPDKLIKLFQPIPGLRPLFASVLLALEKPILWRFRIYLHLSFGYFFRSLAGAAAGGAAGFALGFALAYLGIWSEGARVLPYVGAFAGQIYSLLLRLGTAVTEDLVQARFGLCPGIQQPGYREPALLEWLSAHLDNAAGLGPDEGPLTFGHLQSKGITLEMLTTSLAEGRPYRLPFKDRRFFYDPLEFENLFPESVMKALEASSTLSKSGKYRQLPEGEHLPVIVAIRMSLSFPLLLQAIPLYAQDFTLLDEKEQKKLQRCLFSDGGISSNLPIHFFDSPLPSRPTFAINLEDFDETRHKDRVELPLKAQEQQRFPLKDISSTKTFLAEIFNSMQNWQDNLRLRQPGTRERVVAVRLKDGQGGLNLKMASEDVDELINLGDQAGELLRTKFDFAGHRWRRYIVWSGAWEQSMDQASAAYNIALVDQEDERIQEEYRQNPWQEGQLNYHDFLESHEPGEYKVEKGQKADTEYRTKVLFETFSKLNQMAPKGDEEEAAAKEKEKPVKEKRLRRFNQGPNPKPPSRLSLTPEH